MNRSTQTLALTLITLAVFGAPDLSQGSIWTSATETVAANSYGANAQNPHINVRQKLPVGDKMTATFTTDDGAVITNQPQGTVPTYEGTVGAGTQGISFTAAGIINGKIVKDIHQTHTAPGIPDGTLEVAAFGNDSLGGLIASGVGEWLSDHNYDDSWISVPDFRSVGGPDIFYGIDLQSWNSVGITDGDTLELMFGSEFDVIDGYSAQFPGVLFGSSPGSHGNSGWQQSQPFTGRVVIDSYHQFSVPEPGSIGLLALGGLSLIRKRRAL